MINLIRNNYVKLILISFLGLILDYLWLIQNQDITPGWDQGYHLSNTFKMYNILGLENLNIADKYTKILEVTDNYRGPLTYLISALFLKFFKNNSYVLTYLSNNIFNIISIFSIYNICCLFNKKNIGIWSSVIFTFSPFIAIQRTDYLIDYSLTAFSILFFSFLTNWFLDKKQFSIHSIFSGITYGFIFLVKPTGITFFLIPLVVLFIKKFLKDSKTKKGFIQEIISFCSCFFLIIFPWFSKNWLTIISSTINAWEWGIKYQDGLESNSLQGWLYYFKELPNILGTFSFCLIITFIFISLIDKKTYLINIFKTNKKIHLWFASYLINGFLILSLMSTKDPRFIMPIYPIICIYIGFIVNQNNRRDILRLSKKLLISLFLFITLVSKLEVLNYKFTSQKTNFSTNWHHKNVVEDIAKENPLINQTLAILPDTKEINTFNFEAEAIRQGEKLTVRQVISNEKNYKDDLKYFDWFLLKTGDQGIMNNKAKKLLNNYLIKNNSFIKHSEWDLPDESKLILMRRNILNSHVKEVDCNNIENSFDLENINNNIFKIKITDKAKNINDAILFINFLDNKSKQNLDIPLLNGRLYKNLKSGNCYKLNQYLPNNLKDSSISKNLQIKAKLLRSNGEIVNLNSQQFNLTENINENSEILYSNKIYDVQKLGSLLKDGKFEDLFYLVGILNQSDPSQVYLEQAEQIFKQRYKEDKSLNYLYNILISQILQRKAKEAELTLEKIILKDSSNGNIYLTKSIIEIYLLNLQKAKKTITVARSLPNKSPESDKLIEDIDKILKIF